LKIDKPDDETHTEEQTVEAAASAKVGYKRPPVHSRFKPGQSGNPGGRPKGSQNFKTLLDRILKEEVSLQDGTQSRKISKAEAIMRRLIVGALKGDTRDLHALFKLAEQTGQFEEKPELKRIERIVVQWVDPPLIPDNSDISKD
jgi:uncharacterized protein DUF5681